MPHTNSEKSKHRYGIGAVARMTGLTDHTIRVWERRYGAVVADRAANGRREYAECDVEKLMLLKRLTDEGLAISKIADLTIEALRERADEMRQITGSQAAEAISVAVLGAQMTAVFAASARNNGLFSFVSLESNREQFLADLRQQSVDLLALEVPVLDAGAIGDIRELQALAEAPGSVLMYRFGRSKDLERARDLGIHVLRVPADVETATAVFVRASMQTGVDRKPKNAGHGTIAGSHQTTHAIPPRQFSAAQLAQLTQISTTIDCECPQHLASLVNDLCAFEIYSANCKNRNEQDRELHHYLHEITAKARADIETALQRVVLEEGLDV